MKKEIVCGVFILVCMMFVVFSFSSVCASTYVEGTTSVSFASGTSDNPNASVTNLTNIENNEKPMEAKSEFIWIVSILLIIALVVYFVSSFKKSRAKRKISRKR